MSEPLRSANILADRILGNTQLRDKLKTDPETVLRSTADEVTRELPPPAFVSDVWTYRMVVIALGIVCVAAIGGAIYLTARAGAGTASPVPDTLTALGATAIGALAGLLAPSPKGK
jgi:hypothetical protein